MTASSRPESLAEFRERLLEISESLPRRLRQCADYVARHSDRIAISTVAEMAAAAGVQPSAFMRFCQLMGFSGYSEMQRLFRSEQARHWPDYATRLENLRKSGGDTPAALVAEFVEAGRGSLERLATGLDQEILERAVAILAAAPLVHVMGLSRAFPVATYLTYIFEKMNIPALLHDRVGNIDHRHTVRQGDVLLAISFAPYSAETLELARDSRQRGASVIAITDALNSPLHACSAATLVVSETDVGAFRTLSATLSLATALGVAVGAARGNPSAQAQGG